MIYVIHNVMDSCENIQGLRYRVIVMEDSVRDESSKVREQPDPRIKNLAVVEAKYDIKFYHDSAVMECFDIIRKHSKENGNNIITIESHYSQ